MLGPIHIAFIQMIIDPVCSLAFEAESEERNVMQRPPRRADTPLFSHWLVSWSVIQGSVVLAVTGGLTLYFWRSGLNATQLRSAAFLALVLGITSLILINRRFGASMRSALRSPNPVLRIVLGLVAIMLAATQFVPAIADLFAFGRVTGQAMLVIGLASSAALFLLEQLKPHWGKRLLE
ncbi:MAG: cation-translocating P-type ATPase C-terminal domain-containing protein [Novosphingobium sp.]